MVKNRYFSFIFASKCSQRAIWLIFGDILSVNVKFSQFFLFVVDILAMGVLVFQSADK